MKISSDPTYGDNPMYRIIITMLIISSSLIGNASSASEKKEPTYEESVYDGLRTFAQVLHKVNALHYHPKDIDQCMNKAIDAFVSCLDPHSSFLDQQSYKHMMESTSGEFFGVGIVIDNTRVAKDKHLLVIDLVPEGPAEAAGIRPLDKIIDVDGEPLEHMTTEQAMSKIKGPRGTKVKLTISREGQLDLLSYEITRDAIKENNSLCFSIDNQGISYIALTMFTEKALKQMEELLKKTMSKEHKALIIDLRNNSGGLLTSVVDIAGLFLKKGSVVVTTKNKNGVETKRCVTLREPLHNAKPIFILINNYTASAAEILSGCLKIHSETLTQQDKQAPMVFLVGSRTFGKGSVQDVIPLNNNCAVKLTESLYFLPQDTSIQGEGITPDFEIEKNFPPTEQMLWFKKTYGSESAFTNYIRLHNTPVKKDTSSNNDNKKLPWAERMKKNLEQDNQLRGTIDIINTYLLILECHPEKVKTRRRAVDYLNSLFTTNKPLGLTQISL